MAYSGGPDSTALLFLLKELQTMYNLKLACAYVDHGIRSPSESRKERDLVRQNCGNLDIPCYYHDIPFGELAVLKKKTGRSMEELAREKRYSFFNELQADFPHTAVATGHTADDQLETIFMRLCQGSGPAGLQGIQPVSRSIMRPLLDCSRKEILDYLTGNKICYSTDSSNLETVYLRNKIRHLLVPVVKEIFPGIRRSMESVSAKMAMTQQFIEKTAAEKLSWESAQNGYCIRKDIFFKESPAVRLESVYQIYRQFFRRFCSDLYLKQRLPYKFLLPLLGSAARDEKNRVFCTGHGIKFSTRQQFLFLESCVVSPVKKDYVISVEIGKPFRFQNLSGTFSCSEPLQKESENAVFIQENEMVPPVIVRSWHDGDRIYLGYGRKKIKKIFQDWKLNSEQRHLIPIVEDEKGILAIVGRLFGGKNIVRFTKKGERVQSGKMLVLDLH
ncbi:MAG: tRNA lysidine(34) synthetase TilS [Spirochaetales bacterium]|nr:tRNA lysidine(34) synthetase TilS [Spirochaetales bacterium]